MVIQNLPKSRFKLGRDKGCEFLKSQLNADGSFGLPERGLADYYKVPLALMVSGASAEANRLFQWIRNNSLNANNCCLYFYKPVNFITL